VSVKNREFLPMMPFYGRITTRPFLSRYGWNYCNTKASARMSTPRLGDPSTVPAGTAPRLEYVDGLRALAALWVARHHAIETSVPAATLKVPVLGPAVASLFFGQFPVMVFLMLSGFCLYYPYVRKTPTRPEFSGWLAFMRRRWIRIAPPYLWAG